MNVIFRDVKFFPPCHFLQEQVSHQETAQGEKRVNGELPCEDVERFPGSYPLKIEIYILIRGKFSFLHQ